MRALAVCLLLLSACTDAPTEPCGYEGGFCCEAQACDNGLTCSGVMATSVCYPDHYDTDAAPRPDAEPAPDAAVADAEVADAEWPDGHVDAGDCGLVGQPCCTGDPFHPCSEGLTCGVPPQTVCTPIFGAAP